MSKFHRLLVPAALAAMLALPGGARAGDFAAFFEDFRTALGTGDYEALARMTEFPLTVRGTSDADPQRTIGAPDFEAEMRRLVEGDVGLSAKPESLGAYIERVDAATLATDPATESVRTGSLLFTRQPEGWRLTQAYEGD